MRFTALSAKLLPVSEKTCWIFLCLGDDAGRMAWGEATHFGHEAEICALAQALGESLAARPAVGLGDLLARVRQADMAAPRRALASALEQAALSLQAEAAGLSLAQSLGGPFREAVPFYANVNRGITDRSPEGFAAQAARMHGETGASGIKIAPFDGYRFEEASPSDARGLIALGLDRVAAVRAALPAGALLMVDCHARFDGFTARQVMAELGRIGTYWIEEPCRMEVFSPSEQRSLRAAAHAAGLRLAGAETLADCAGMAAVLAAGGHDVVLPDLRQTGVAEGMAMLRMAAAAGVSVSLHNPVGPVLDHVSTQVAAALPAFHILERQVGESPLFHALRGAREVLAEGHVIPEPDGLAQFNASLLHDAAPGAQAKLSFAGMAGAGPDA
ncbi:enolase C-terminal domain-like protein [Pseudoruegeria sp. SHC-113]|uniref:enolase C-terminal domain-like protein n=1 Tax=Pseudoruegeria sp. SHC-113 TaxID=2855439 RepID=UPI0021BAA30C|nr:enolase C-terminal domain-like protein [Pseudoruegeria sp. SHC-113]MCT8158676.1 hypothetical protein [Pseudoruegeria sp. SHC-113]